MKGSKKERNNLKTKNNLKEKKIITKSKNVMNEYEIDDISLHNENFFNFWLLKCAIRFRAHNDTVIFGYLRQSLQNVKNFFFF